MFHDKVIKDVHKNGQDASVRTICIDRQRMFELFYAQIPAGQPKELRLSVSAASPGDNVKYFADAFGGKGEFVVGLAMVALALGATGAVGKAKPPSPRIP